LVEWESMAWRRGKLKHLVPKCTPLLESRRIPPSLINKRPLIRSDVTSMLSFFTEEKEILLKEGGWRLQSRQNKKEEEWCWMIRRCLEFRVTAKWVRKEGNKCEVDQSSLRELDACTN
jgi:hypothetical protein